MAEIVQALIKGQSEWLDVSDSQSYDIIKIEANRYHLLFNNKSSILDIMSVEDDPKCVLFKLDDHIYEVTLKDNIDALIDEMGLHQQEDNHDQDILAPMPGKVLSILVGESEFVEADQPLLILEAMKMENVLKANRNGQISKVWINEQDTVQKNDVLITFEV